MDVYHAILGFSCGVLLFLLIRASRPRRSVTVGPPGSRADFQGTDERPFKEAIAHEAPRGLDRTPDDCPIVVIFSASHDWPAGRLQLRFGLLRDLLKVSARDGFGDWKGSTQGAYRVLMGLAARSSCSIFAQRALISRPIPAGQSWPSNQVNLNFCRLRKIDRSFQAYEETNLERFLEEIDYSNPLATTEAFHALRVALGREFFVPGPGSQFLTIPYRLEKF